MQSQNVLKGSNSLTAVYIILKEYQGKLNMCIQYGNILFLQSR